MRATTPGLVHRFLEVKAARAPERPLCLDGDRTADYGEIESGANRVAHALMQRIARHVYERT